jgi:hypothetical protein
MNLSHLVSAALDLLARGEAQPVGHRTINGASISAIMDRLYFGDFHIFEQLSSGPEGDRINLIGRKGPADAPPVWLVAQTGLGAPPVPSRWPDLDGAPVSPRRLAAPDRLAAFGAQSGRMDLLAKIVAASSLPAARLARPIHVAALSGEEGLGTGAPLLFPEGGGRSGGTALVHAPTAGALWSSHPGCILLDLTVTRRTRHRRMPPHGGFWQLRFDAPSGHVNLRAGAHDALAVALDAIHYLRARGEVRVLSLEAGETGTRRPASATVVFATQDPEAPDLSSVHPRLSVSPLPDGAAVPLPIDGLLDGWLAARAAGIAAIASNLALARPVRADGSGPILAHGADAVTTGRLSSERDGLRGLVAIWTGPEADADALCQGFFEAAARTLADDDERALDGDVIAVRPAYGGPPTGSQLVAHALDALAVAGLPTRLEPGVTTTDAGRLAELGLETLVFGPTGPLERLHGDREAIEVSSLASALAFYTAMLGKLCLRP